mmetsp:Transcript_20029/g.28195  ORF Transcript_20029/g.28195 Transcript_20029/m.28195 type:complete len:205 (+) Transcript_20029:164-778(+)
MVFYISKWQGGGLARWQPAQWIPGVREFHRSRMIWRFGCDNVFLMNMLPDMLKSIGFTVYTSDVKEITAGRFSDVLQYLHTVKLRVIRRGVAVCTLEATCGSAAACPAWVPMSLLLSIPLSWLPFPDCGSNESILRRIKQDVLVRSSQLNYGIICTGHQIIERGSSCKCTSLEIPTSLTFFVVFIMGPAVIFVTILNLSGILRM